MQNITAALALTFAALAIGPAWADSKVTSCTSDRQSGAGTNLATAIQAGGLITFECPGEATIQMSGTHQITRAVIIDGGGRVTLLEGQQPMFAAVSTPASLELKNLKSPQAESALTISGSTFTNSETPFRNQNGPMTIRDSVFTNNTGIIVGAGDTLTIERSRFVGTKGIAVFHMVTDRTLRVTDSEFTNNSSGALMVGTGSANNLSQTLEILRSTFTDNGRDEKNPTGGNVFGAVSFSCSTSARSCTARITSSKFSGNRAEDGGAVRVSGAALVSLQNVRFEDNVARGSGGAVFFDAESAPNPKLELQHAIFTSNRAIFGGAVSVRRSGLTGTAVTFSKNQAEQTGGAIGVDGDVQIIQGVFVDNVAVAGSAAAVNARSSFANTLMARNRATLGEGLTGATFVGADARFVNSTIMDNVGGGIGHTTSPGSVGPHPIVLRNTIVAVNSGGNCQSGAGLPPPGTVAPNFVSEGNNLEFPTKTCAADISVAKPNLDPLYIPILGSPAKGNGHTPTCLADPVSGRDVYGMRRPQGTSCSIGAAEGELEKNVVERLVKRGSDNNGSKIGKGGGVGQQPTETGQCCCCCSGGSCGR
jgi:predicted outer membrane repeat protein